MGGFLLKKSNKSLALKSIAVALVAAMIATMPGITAWADIPNNSNNNTGNCSYGPCNGQLGLPLSGGSNLPPQTATSPQSPKQSYVPLVPENLSANNTASNLQIAGALLNLAERIAPLLRGPDAYASAAQQFAYMNAASGGVTHNVESNVSLPADVIGTINGQNVTAADIAPGGRFAFSKDWSQLESDLVGKAHDLMEVGLDPKDLISYLKNNDVDVNKYINDQIKAKVDAKNQQQADDFDNARGDQLQKMCDGLNCHKSREDSAKELANQMAELIKDLQETVYEANDVYVYLQTEIESIKTQLTKKYGDASVGLNQLIEQKVNGGGQLGSLGNLRAPTGGKTNADSTFTIGRNNLIKDLQRACAAKPSPLDQAMRDTWAYELAGVNRELYGVGDAIDCTNFNKTPSVQKSGLYAKQKELIDQQKAAEAVVQELKTNFLDKVTAFAEGGNPDGDVEVANSSELLRSKIKESLGQAHDPTDTTKHDADNPAQPIPLDQALQKGRSKPPPPPKAKKSTNQVAQELDGIRQDLGIVDFAKAKKIDLSKIALDVKSFDPIADAQAKSRQVANALEKKANQSQKQIIDVMMKPYRADQATGKRPAWEHVKDVVKLYNQADTMQQQLQKRMHEYDELAKKIKNGDISNLKDLRNAVATMRCKNSNSPTCVVDNIVKMSQQFITKDGQKYFNQDYIPAKYLPLAFDVYGAAAVDGGWDPMQEYQKFKMATFVGPPSPEMIKNGFQRYNLADLDPTLYSKYIGAQFDPSVAGSFAAGFAPLQQWNSYEQARNIELNAAQGQYSRYSGVLQDYYNAVGAEWLAPPLPSAPPAPDVSKIMNQLNQQQFLPSNQNTQPTPFPSDFLANWLDKQGWAQTWKQNVQTQMDMFSYIIEHPLDATNQILQNMNDHPWNTVAGLGGVVIGGAATMFTFGASSEATVPLMGAGFVMALGGTTALAHEQGYSKSDDNFSWGDAWSGIKSGVSSTVSGFLVLGTPAVAEGTLALAGKFGGWMKDTAIPFTTNVVRTGADFFGFGGDAINDLNLTENIAAINRAVAKSGGTLTGLDVGESMALKASEAPRIFSPDSLSGLSMIANEGFKNAIYETQIGTALTGLKDWSQSIVIAGGNKVSNIASDIGDAATAAWNKFETFSPTAAQVTSDTAAMGTQTAVTLYDVGATVARGGAYVVRGGSKLLGSYLDTTIPLSLRVYGAATMATGTLTPDGIVGAVMAPGSILVGAGSLIGGILTGSEKWIARGDQGILGNTTVNSLLFSAPGAVKNFVQNFDPKLVDAATYLDPKTGLPQMWVPDPDRPGSQKLVPWDGTKEKATIFDMQGAGWSASQQTIDGENWGKNSNASLLGKAVAGLSKVASTAVDVRSFVTGAKLVGTVASEIFGANAVGDLAQTVAMQSQMVPFYKGLVENFGEMVNGLSAHPQGPTMSVSRYLYEVGTFALGVGAAGKIPSSEVNIPSLELTRAPESPSLLSATVKEAGKMATLGALGTVLPVNLVTYGGAFGVPVYEATAQAYRRADMGQATAALGRLQMDAQGTASLLGGDRSEVVGYIGDHVTRQGDQFLVNGVTVPKDVVPEVKAIWEARYGNGEVPSGPSLGDGSWFRSPTETPKADVPTLLNPEAVPLRQAPVPMNQGNVGIPAVSELPQPGPDTSRMVPKVDPELVARAQAAVDRAQAALTQVSAPEDIIDARVALNIAKANLDRVLAGDTGSGGHDVIGALQSAVEADKVSGQARIEEQLPREPNLNGTVEDQLQKSPIKVEPPDATVAPNGMGRELLLEDSPSPVITEKRVEAPAPTEADQEAARLAQRVNQLRADELMARMRGDNAAATEAQAARLSLQAERQVVVDQQAADLISHVRDQAAQSTLPDYEAERARALARLQEESAKTRDNLEQALETAKLAGDQKEIQNLTDLLAKHDAKVEQDADAQAKDVLDRAAAERVVLAQRAENIMRTGRDLTRQQQADALKVALNDIQIGRRGAESVNQAFDLGEKVRAAQTRINDATEIVNNSLDASVKALDSKRGLYADQQEALKQASKALTDASKEIDSTKRRELLDNRQRLLAKADELGQQIRRIDLSTRNEELTSRISQLEQKDAQLVVDSKTGAVSNALNGAEKLELAQLRLEQAQTQLQLQLTGADSHTQAQLMQGASGELGALQKAVEEARVQMQKGTAIEKWTQFKSAQETKSADAAQLLNSAKEMRDRYNDLKAKVERGETLTSQESAVLSILEKEARSNIANKEASSYDDLKSKIVAAKTAEETAERPQAVDTEYFEKVGQLIDDAVSISQARLKFADSQIKAADAHIALIQADGPLSKLIAGFSARNADRATSADLRELARQDFKNENTIIKAKADELATLNNAIKEAIRTNSKYIDYPPGSKTTVPIKIEDAQRIAAAMQREIDQRQMAVKMGQTREALKQWQDAKTTGAQLIDNATKQAVLNAEVNKLDKTISQLEAEAKKAEAENNIQLAEEKKSLASQLKARRPELEQIVKAHVDMLEAERDVILKTTDEGVPKDNQTVADAKAKALKDLATKFEAKYWKAFGEDPIKPETFSAEARKQRAEALADNSTRQRILDEIFGPRIPGKNGEKGLTETEAIVFSELLARDVLGYRNEDGSKVGLKEAQLRMIVNNLVGNIVELAMGAGKTPVLSAVFGIKALMGEPVNGHLIVADSKEISKYTNQNPKDFSDPFFHYMRAMGIDVVGDGNNLYEKGKGDNRYTALKGYMKEGGNKVTVFSLDAYGHLARAQKESGSGLRAAMKANMIGVDEADVAAMMRKSFNVGKPIDATEFQKTDVHILLSAINDLKIQKVDIANFRHEMPDGMPKYAYAVDRQGNIVYTDDILYAMGKIRTSDGSIYTAHDITEVLRAKEDISQGTNRVVVLDGEVHKSSLKEGLQFQTRDQSNYYQIAAVYESETQAAIRTGRLEAGQTIAADAVKRIGLTSHGTEATISEAFARIGGKDVLVFGGSGTLQGAEAIARTIYGADNVITVQGARYEDFAYKAHAMFTDPATGETRVRWFDSANGKVRTDSVADYVAMQAQRSWEWKGNGRGFLGIFGDESSLRSSLNQFFAKEIVSRLGDGTLEAQDALRRLREIDTQSQIGNAGRIGSRDISVKNEGTRGDSFIDLVRRESGVIGDIASRVEVLDGFTDSQRMEEIAARTAGGKDAKGNPISPLAVFAVERAGRALNFKGEVNLVVVGAEKFDRGDLLQILGRTGRTGGTAGPNGDRYDTERNVLVDIKTLSQNADVVSRMSDYLGSQEGSKDLSAKLSKIADAMKDIPSSLKYENEWIPGPTLNKALENNAQFRLMEERSAAASFRLSSEVVTKLAKEPLGLMTEELQDADSPDARILQAVQDKLREERYNNSRNTYEAGKFKSAADIAKEQFNSGLSQAEAMWRELAEKKSWVIKVKDENGNEKEQRFELSESLKAEAAARLTDVLKTKAIVDELFKGELKDSKATFAKIDSLKVDIANQVAEVVRVLSKDLLPSESSVSVVAKTVVTAENAIRDTIDGLRPSIRDASDGVRPDEAGAMGARSLRGEKPLDPYNILGQRSEEGIDSARINVNAISQQTIPVAVEQEQPSVEGAQRQTGVAVAIAPSEVTTPAPERVEPVSASPASLTDIKPIELPEAAKTLTIPEVMLIRAQAIQAVQQAGMQVPPLVQAIAGTNSIEDAARILYREAGVRAPDSGSLNIGVAHWGRAVFASGIGVIPGAGQRVVRTTIETVRSGAREIGSGGYGLKTIKGLVMIGVSPLLGTAAAFAPRKLQIDDQVTLLFNAMAGARGVNVIPLLQRHAQANPDTVMTVFSDKAIDAAGAKSGLRKQAVVQTLQNIRQVAATAPGKYQSIAGFEVRRALNDNVVVVTFDPRSDSHFDQAVDLISHSQASNSNSKISVFLNPTPEARQDEERMNALKTAVQRANAKGASVYLVDESGEGHKLSAQESKPTETQRMPIIPIGYWTQAKNAIQNFRGKNPESPFHIERLLDLHSQLQSLSQSLEQPESENANAQRVIDKAREIQGEIKRLSIQIRALASSRALAYELTHPAAVGFRKDPVLAMLKALAHAKNDEEVMKILNDFASPSLTTRQQRRIAAEVGINLVSARPQLNRTPIRFVKVEAQPMTVPQAMAQALSARSIKAARVNSMHWNVVFGKFIDTIKNSTAYQGKAEQEQIAQLESDVKDFVAKLPFQARREAERIFDKVMTTTFPRGETISQSVQDTHYRDLRSDLLAKAQKDKQTVWVVSDQATMDRLYPPMSSSAKLPGSGQPVITMDVYNQYQAALRDFQANTRRERLSALPVSWKTGLTEPADMPTPVLTSGRVMLVSGLMLGVAGVATVLGAPIIVSAGALWAGLGTMGALLVYKGGLQDALPLLKAPAPEEASAPALTKPASSKPSAIDDMMPNPKIIEMPIKAQPGFVRRHMATLSRIAAVIGALVLISDARAEGITKTLSAVQNVDPTHLFVYIGALVSAYFFRHQIASGTRTAVNQLQILTNA